MRAAYEQIAPLVQRCIGAAGDFAEFGVCRGVTFLPLAEAARAAGKRCHAVDSFQGCAEPSLKDYNPDGSCDCPRGALGVGGSREFRKLVEPLDGHVRVWEGWVPAILKEMAAEVGQLAFAHLDLDQYEATLAGLRWCWPRMSPGGILCCHDWFPHYTQLASRAIRDWMAEADVEPSGATDTRHIWFQG